MEIQLSPANKEKLLLAQILEWQLGILLDGLEETHGIKTDREGAIQALRNPIAKQRREHLIRAVKKGDHEDPGRLKEHREVLPERLRANHRRMDRDPGSPRPETGRGLAFRRGPHHRLVSYADHGGREPIAGCFLGPRDPPLWPVVSIWKGDPASQSVLVDRMLGPRTSVSSLLVHMKTVDNSPVCS
jgi:hypothetical protein